MGDLSFSALEILAVGIAATAALDLWALLLRCLFGFPIPDWGLVGRWFGYLPRGVFVHHPITDSPPIPFERRIGWIAHYAVGVLYALIYFLLLWIFSWQLSLLNAIAFGLFTVGAGWFILQPGLGLGVCSRLAPNPLRVRSLNIIAHTIFGCAIYFATRLIQLATQ
jgi:hypothetical protein